MQANPVDVMASEQLGGGWNAFPYGFGEYGVPSGDWITSLSTELDTGPVGCEPEGQQRTESFPPVLGGGVHRISPLDSPIEPDSTEPKYPHAVPYHLHQPPNYAAQCYQHLPNAQQKQSQAGMKHPPNNARFVPHGYYTSSGRTPAVPAGPTMTQTNLYPSPPGQSLSPQESNYGKPYGLLYMHGDHVPPPIAFAGHTEPALSTLSGGPLANDLYQPYNQPSGYEESTSAYMNVGLPLVESSLPVLKYDAWTTEPNAMMSPMGHPTYGHGHPALAIKQEYHSPAYISPSPSSMAGSSSVKTELLSDTSQSPPPTTSAHQPSLAMAQSSHKLSPALPKDTTDYGTPAVRKPARNTNNYGTQFVCPECSRTFARQCGLTQHMKWHHSGEKPFRCLICGKCFAAQQALDEHIERHMTTDKPYRCQECTKAFFHKNDLRRHAYQHSGMAPHACRYCTKTFARKDHCHSHEYSHERKLQRKERKAKGRAPSIATDSILMPMVTPAAPSPIVGSTPDFMDAHQIKLT
uniref:C2H2-type domain-containing protein n=1 Tax=Anopheles dirus TaxID=7168 RepID=A0A1Y9H2C1_9DIPT